MRCKPYVHMVSSAMGVSAKLRHFRIHWPYHCADIWGTTVSVDQFQENLGLWPPWRNCEHGILCHTCTLTSQLFYNILLINLWKQLTRLYMFLTTKNCQSWNESEVVQQECFSQLFFKMSCSYRSFHCFDKHLFQRLAVWWECNRKLSVLLKVLMPNKDQINMLDRSKSWLLRML